MENATQTETFEAALERFVNTCQANCEADRARRFPGSQAFREYKLVAMESGVKYVRIVETNGGEGRSAWCFVERATGNVLKCDGWKRPAKGVRGSIYAETFEGYGCGVYGPHYLTKGGV